MDRDGRELFSLRFDMPETVDGDGNSSFVFVLPARYGWEAGLASIILTGPGGAATLDRDTNRPMTILRDPRTDQVRGFLRSPPAAVVSANGAVAPDIASQVGQDIEVLFSRGLPGSREWRR